MTNDKRYVLWGSAGHAKVLNEAIKRLGGRVIALFDNNPHASSAVTGIPLFGGTEALPAWAAATPNRHEVYGLVAIGGANGHDRLALQGLLMEHGLRLEALLHPFSFVANDATIGIGSQILAKAVIGSETRIGAGCIVNHNASIDHECHISDGVHVAPGATICGCVSIDAITMIGAGAVVLPRVHIGSNSIIGAGAVVTRDVDDGVIVTGSPAKVVRLLENTTKYNPSY